MKALVALEIRRTLKRLPRGLAPAALLMLVGVVAGAPSMLAVMAPVVLIMGLAAGPIQIHLDRQDGTLEYLSFLPYSGLQLAIARYSAALAAILVCVAIALPLAIIGLQGGIPFRSLPSIAGFVLVTIFVLFISSIVAIAVVARWNPARVLWITFILFLGGSFALDAMQVQTDVGARLLELFTREFYRAPAVLISVPILLVAPLLALRTTLGILQPRGDVPSQRAKAAVLRLRGPSKLNKMS